jgi:predicted Zn-dependent protease
VRYEPNNAVAWRLLSIAYGRDGNIGMTALALAETNLLRGKLNDAIDQAERAMRLLPEGTPDWIRAEDILIEAQRKKNL